MASLSNAVTIIVVFAILIQFLVDRVKELVGDKVMNIVKAPVWAVAFGALFALMFDIDFFALIRDLYKDYHIEGISRNSNLTNKLNADTFDEVIIKNF